MTPLSERQRKKTREAVALARSRLALVEIEDPEVEGYLHRLVWRLEALLDFPPQNPDLLSYPIRTLLPLLDLDWLSAGRREQTEMDRKTIEGLRRERRQIALDSTELPPGDASCRLSLIDILVESLEIFLVYPDENARLRCLALLMDLLENGLGQDSANRETSAPAKTWVC